jgi:hypothetical protein
VDVDFFDRHSVRWGIEPSEDQLMLKTFFALVLSTGLVACVTDDSIDSEERAENPDVLPNGDNGDQVDPTDVTENPNDVPGSIPARSEGGSHVPIQNQVTTDMGVAHGTDVTGQVNTVGSGQDLGFNRGITDVVGGQTVGSTCDGQQFDCRTADPQVIDGTRSGVYTPGGGTGKPGKP